MNKFLFYTHITPQSKRSAFRQALIDIYFNALRNQIYSDWKVIIIGEEEKIEGRFNYFSLGNGTQEEKVKQKKKLFLKKEVVQLFDEADYVIKLDDDDIISPNLLEHLKDFTGDIYYDRFHTFIDSSSGVVTQQERGWMASTCVHKKEHILAAWNKAGASSVGNLLYSDHSKTWHLYYANKKKEAADKTSPVYLRVLSPTSITSGAFHGPPKTILDVNMERYYNYLGSFGKWERVNVPEFDKYCEIISSAWKFFAGEMQKPLPDRLHKRKSFINSEKIKKIFSPRKEK